jgi:hypothetical protein
MMGTKFVVDGKDVEVQMSASGFYFMIDGIEFVHFDGAATAERIRDLTTGWRAGRAVGERYGRSKLQNEFRNLMDCQPR